MRKDRTKLALAAALQQMLKSKSLDEVRVCDLCESCDLQRQSFYYHFQDKYDLVAWVFLQDFRAGFSSNDDRLSLKCITDILRCAYEKKDFYLRVLADRSQNIPLLYIHDHIYEYSLNLFRKRDGVEQLPEVLCVRAQMLVYGAMGVAYEWLKGKIDMEPDELAKVIFEMIPLDMLHA